MCADIVTVLVSRSCSVSSIVRQYFVVDEDRLLHELSIELSKQPAGAENDRLWVDRLGGYVTSSVDDDLPSILLTQSLTSPITDAGRDVVLDELRLRPGVGNVDVVDTGTVAECVDSSDTCLVMLLLWC